VKQLGHRRQSVQLEIQNLEAAFKEWDAKALHTSRKMVEYDRIRQDLQRLQGAYDKLLGVVQSVDVGKKLDQENVSVLEPASAARPLHRMLRNMLMAFAAALLCSAAFFYFAFRFDDRFASLSELADDLAETAIGQIPKIALKGPNGKLGLETLEKQRFEFLEAFRSMRSLLLSMNDGAGAVTPKIIMIGSSVPKEGKSTVAMYLAATLSLGGSQVLLIDADMRRSSLHKYCGLRSSPGLAEVLAGESLNPAIVSTTLPNLSLLPAGEARQNPGELVQQGEWAALMKEVRQHFDYVIIDTPPLLATDDAATLARKADTVLFVVRGSFTSARMARRALDVLKQRRIPVLGLVFNRANFSRYENHYYEQYRDSYGWRPKRGRNGKTAAPAAAVTAVELKSRITRAG
jgi:capsular exopolysaccharide synthesis family protein